MNQHMEQLTSGWRKGRKISRMVSKYLAPFEHIHLDNGNCPLFCNVQLAPAVKVQLSVCVYCPWGVLLSISIHSDAYILVNSFVCPSPENTWPPYKHNQKQKIESRLRLSQKKKKKKDETCQNGWIEKETCALSEFLNCSNVVTFNEYFLVFLCFIREWHLLIPK